MHDQWQEWYDTTLLPLLQHSPDEPHSSALQNLLALDPDEVDLAILSADTDRTQAYVFESAKLPEVRGGSERLCELNLRLPQLLAEAGLPAGFVDEEQEPGCVIYAGGGSLLAFVPSSIAEELAQSIEVYYPSKTGTATMTCVWRAVSPQEVLFGLGGERVSWKDVEELRTQLKAEDWKRVAQTYGIEEGKSIPEEAFRRQRGFGQMTEVMAVLLRRRKQQPAVVPSVETFPFAIRCQVCQTRPAERTYRYFDEPWPICDVCRRKVPPKVGGAREARSQQVERFLEWLNDHPTLKDSYWRGDPEINAHPAQDLGELGAACQARPGYIGFIYADGNRVGRMLESLTTPRSYRRVSRAIQTVVEEITYQALAESLRLVVIERFGPTGASLGKGYIHPLEPLMIGGDDLMVIVPGDAALPIATRLCQLFERKMQEAIPEEVWSLLPEALRHPTLAAGVVIADSHNPVRVLQQISKELCSSAKQRAYDEERRAGVHTSAIDFLLLKSQSMLRRDVDKLRKVRPYYFEEAGRKAGRHMTAAPYTLEEARRLLKLLKLMRQEGFATSQLHGLVSALQKGRQYGTVHYHYQKARLTAREGENVLSLLPEIWSYDALEDPVPWHRVSGAEGKEFATIVPDLLELYPFVPQTAPDALWKEILTEVSNV